MTKVYVVNKSNHDFSKAEKFGELVYVTKGRLHRYNVNDMVRKANEAFENSMKEDYIVLCSLNVLNSVVCATFAMKHKRLNLLLYKSGKYLERNIVY